MRKINFIILFLIVCLGVNAQSVYKKQIRPTKNVILMISDGTSIGVLSAARWFQIYNNASNENLAIDDHLCGLVKTFSSNAPAVDSAPAMSAYVTGIPQQVGNLSVYPPKDAKQDIYPIENDSSKTYQPLATILEAAKYEQHKAVGLVVTVEYPHATPAACASHTPVRWGYKDISTQMVHNNIDVMFAGGTSLLSDEEKHFLEANETLVYKDNIEAFRNFDGSDKIWALFCEKQMPYDLDRDNSTVPSLEEMTEKAIHRLSKEDNGFFLMVEGSQVDYAAHANDAIACITEFLAFDKAVKVAIDFAKTNGETTVIVLSDHGNSGFVIGNREFENYAKRGLDDIFQHISKYKKTARGLEEILLKTIPENMKEVFREYTEIDLTEEELNLLLSSANYTESDYMQMSNNINMASTIAKILNSKTYIGFSSGGHTAEDVFLAVYHPQGDIPLGLNTNVDINYYLQDALGLKTSLSDLTNKLYVKHTELFAGLTYSIEKQQESMMLKVKKGRRVLTIHANTSKGDLNGKGFDIGSVAVYVEKNNTFYLPQHLIEKL